MLEWDPFSAAIATSAGFTASIAIAVAVEGAVVWAIVGGSSSGIVVNAVVAGSTATAAFS